MTRVAWCSGMNLTYELVDDLAFASQNGRNDLVRHVAGANIVELGPLVEYAWLRRQMSLPSLSSAAATSLSERFKNFIAGPRSNEIGSLNDGRAIEFVRLPMQEQGFTAPDWVAFKSRMMFAAQSRGLSSSEAAGVVGAFGEMASNAYEHSARPETAIAAFHAGSTSFEFVVADAGIGAAASLRSCEEYRHVHDPGDALLMCISEGVSRHGEAGLRGLGFQVLFARLADLNARVRIRSDNQVIDLRGDRLGPRWAIPAGRPPVPGVLISAQCFTSA